MQLLLALAAGGAALNLLLLIVSGRRLRHAHPALTGLYLAANVALLLTVALARVPAEWGLALLFVPVLGFGAIVIRNWTAPARACFTTSPRV